MPSYLRTTAGGKAISGGALAPRTNRYNAGSVATNALGLVPATVPTLSAYSYGADGAFTFTITNYDATATYVLATTAGSISRSTNTVTVSGLGNGATATATVTIQKSGFSDASASITGQTKPVCSSCGGGTTSVQGCNGGTCGIIACGSGYCPAYDIVFYYSPSPNPCVGCAAAVGGWYCCPCGGACG